MKYSQALLDHTQLSTNTCIRKATEHDQVALVELIYSSGPEIFEFLFTTAKVTAKQFLSHAVKQPKGLLGFNNHSVYEHQGKVVGTGAFYSGGFDYLSLALGIVSPVFQMYHGKDRWTVIDRLRKLDRLMPAPSRNMLYIAHLGVDPTLRGHGIGTELIDYHNPSHNKGSRYKIYSLDVAETNTKAKQLYERIGFKVVQTRSLYSGIDQGPVPKLLRMELTL